MKCGDCINYGTCRLTCNVVRTSDICSSFLGKLSCDGCKYDNDRFSDICYHDCIMFSDYEKEYIGEPIVKDESISCGNCSNDDEDGWQEIVKKSYEEKPMKLNTENFKTTTGINNPDKWSVKMKPQFTEEEAHDFYEETDLDQIIEIKYFIEKLKNSGYIRKSDLEILVDEAEEMWKTLGCNTSYNEMKEILYAVNTAFMALKTSHPEYNK